MPNNKINNRLAKLEERSAAKVGRQHDVVYIPALTEETDEQAVQKRLSIPEYASYSIIVFRRLGKGFECKTYDQDFSHTIEHHVWPDQSVYIESKNMNSGDYEILFRYFDRELCGLEGRDLYIAKAP